jgi:hypothetical protein
MGVFLLLLVIAGSLIFCRTIKSKITSAIKIQKGKDIANELLSVRGIRDMREEYENEADYEADGELNSKSQRTGRWSDG